MDESRTPRVDSALETVKRAHGKAYECVSVAFARQLERENAELVEALSMLVERDIRRAAGVLMLPFYDADQARFVLNTVRALLARIGGDK